MDGDAARKVFANLYDPAPRNSCVLAAAAELRGLSDTSDSGTPHEVPAERA